MVKARPLGAVGNENDVMARVCLTSLLVALAICVHPRAQAPATAQSGPLEFDVASIKRNMSGPAGMHGTQTLLGGTGQVLTNAPLANVFSLGRPDGVIPANIVNIPGWTKTEYYDITVKSPTGSTPPQIREMWHTLLAQRMKLAAHVEQREATVFNLVLVNGRLGPDLKQSALDCSVPGQSVSNPATRCGFGLTPTSIVSGGATMDVLARVQLSPRVGAPVTDRTGLDGYYAFALNFAAPQLAGAAPPDDLPDLFTALREQLGLKLQPEKTAVPYWVIDHVEHPTEN
jgi:uncharacterized protein (TIGR03435 family)